MIELLKQELSKRKLFGCTVDDILDSLAEILLELKELEYNRGYVDCAKTYEINKTRSQKDIWKVLDQINQQVCSAENFNAKATVCFYGDNDFINYIKKENAFAIKINPIDKESLKLTFDWGQLIVKIYYWEEV